MIEIKVSGDYSKTVHWFEFAKRIEMQHILAPYGKMGVEALRAATPKDSGTTAASWDYEVVREKGQYQINWYNTNDNHHVNIAVILQYGHATRNGGYVQGRDYINPAMADIFDKIAEAAWKAVTKE